nr:MAG TPA: hypothetical protein [Caudoviricetes sp.]
MSSSFVFSFGLSMQTIQAFPVTHVEELGTPSP